jgi:glyoxylase-like metal-dependent hydrolase (beta-lactamase superfamily II)
MSATIATRRFDGATVSVIGTARSYYKPAFPEDGPDWRTSDTPLNDQGQALMGLNTLVVRTRSGVTVVDPASFAPDVTTIGGGSVLIPGPPLDVALAELQLDPAEVERVVVTHGHDDHFVGVLREDGGLRFPNAEHVFPQADWDDIVSRDMYNAEYAQSLLDPVREAGKLRLVSTDVDFGDGLSVLHTPGETRGHQCFRMQAGEEALYYVGDLFHFPIEVQQLRWPVTPRPREIVDELERSRVRVLEDAAGALRSTFLFTHGVFPGWGRAERDAAGSWVWRYEDLSAD